MTKMLKPLVEKETHDVLSIRIALNDITKDILFIWVIFFKKLIWSAVSLPVKTNLKKYVTFTVFIMYWKC